MEWSDIPREYLGTIPSPLQPLTRLTEYLRKRGPCPSLWMKRDDCTGLATGGNKVRKLEFLVADALRLGADVLITQGAVQSNHARQTAAAAAARGLDCQLLLEQRIEGDAEYENSGNVLLDQLLGATIVEKLPLDSDMQEVMEGLAGRLRAQGHVPYVIPGGGSTPVGALGYVLCAEELQNSAGKIDYVVHATGSAGTQAGLVAGFRALGSATRVLGISVRQPMEAQVNTVHELAERTLDYMNINKVIARGDVEVDDRFIGRGYGYPTAEMVSAVKLVARTEGILLDPVYSGKGMAGLLGAIAEQRFRSQDDVVFIHTGGTVGLFGYRSAFA
ncbi:MAG: D-cysteate sulfo-lyase [Acidimicrobiales bacterium]